MMTEQQKHMLQQALEALSVELLDELESEDVLPDELELEELLVEVVSRSVG